MELATATELSARCTCSRASLCDGGLALDDASLGDAVGVERILPVPLLARCACVCVPSSVCPGSSGGLSGVAWL